MLFLNDLGTQMTLQKLKAKHQGNVRDAIREACEHFEETDERFLRMSEGYPEERDLLVRQQVERK